MRNDITKDILENLYLEENLNPYQIATQFDCDHKTIRAYLKKFKIPLRTASEYNYLSKKTHNSISNEMLNTPLSIAAHTMYICEGWHTDKTNCLVFCNQDTMLIDVFIRCIVELYNYTSPITIKICYDKTSIESTPKVRDYKKLYENSGFNIHHIHDGSRKNPIIKVTIGGKNFAREFIANAYSVLQTLTA